MIGSLIRLALQMFVVVVCVGILGLTVGYKMINKKVMVPGVSTGATPCIGAFDEEDPAYTYKVNTTNIVLGIVFVETIIIPVTIFQDYLRCPIAIK